MMMSELLFADYFTVEGGLWLAKFVGTLAVVYGVAVGVRGEGKIFFVHLQVECASPLSPDALLLLTKSFDIVQSCAEEM